MGDVPALTRWRTLVAILRLNPGGLGPEWLQLLVRLAAVGGVGGGLMYVAAPLDFLASMLATGALAACLISGAKSWWPRAEWRSPTLPLDDHPRLRRVLDSASELAGWRPTSVEVRLSAWPRLAAWPDRRDGYVLFLGLPLLMGLDEDDLRALIVRELTLAPSATWRVRWILYLNFLDRGREVKGKSLPQREWLRVHAHRIRSDLWSATAELVGRDVLARATRRACMIDCAFDWHLERYVGLVMSPGGGYVSDIYESFLWKIREDGLLGRMQPNVDSFVAEDFERYEARLLEELGWNTGEPVDPVADPVVAGVTEKLERRLGQVVLWEVTKAASPRIPSHSLHDIPWDEWGSLQAHWRDQVIGAASKLLGQEATARDIVQLAVDGRAGELSWWHADLPCPHPSPAVCVLMPFIDIELRRLGYVAQFLQQRSFVGPLGDTVDLVALVDRAGRGLSYGLELGGSLTERDRDEDSRRLAAESLAAGDPTGWFERLYAESATGEAIVPWDSQTPHPLLVEWLSSASGSGSASGPGLGLGSGFTPSFGAEAGARSGAGRRALVVGCGLGDDAEYVARFGYDTVAFDVSESAVRLAQERFPDSTVDYRAADLLAPPTEWRHAFDLVVEIMTVQALPEHLHAQAIDSVSGFVGPGGSLLVIASAREEGGPVFAPPWPLTPSEIAVFASEGLVVDRVEDLRDPERHRCRAAFHRPAASE
ncbi:methyltransferase domain-containing protein [Nonomuraea sp. CA-143628]|uniref:methyltransferase domain-containing protein n=1 Tax=Nonomuraea sp. CA-143628 TaxID=3239997 RepID=UPI003D8D8CF2